MSNFIYDGKKSIEDSDEFDPQNDLQSSIPYVQRDLTLLL